MSKREEEREERRGQERKEKRERVERHSVRLFVLISTQLSCKNISSHDMQYQMKFCGSITFHLIEFNTAPRHITTHQIT